MEEMDFLKDLYSNYEVDSDEAKTIESICDKVKNYNSNASEWEDKYNKLHQKYVDTFFSNPEEIKKDTKEDIEKDVESPITSFDDLFKKRG